MWIGGTWLAWIAGEALRMILLIPLILIMEVNPNELTLFTTILFVFPQLIIPSVFLGLVQQEALNNYFGLNIKQWWWVTALMWVLGWIAVSGLTNILNIVSANLVHTALLTSLLIGLPGIAQAFLLRSHLAQTWLYGFASVISGVILGALANQDFSQVWLFAPALSAVISAIVLLWLTSQVTGELTQKYKSK